jgi:hypothetical protein
MRIWQLSSVARFAMSEEIPEGAFDMSLLPTGGRNNFWFRRPSSSTAVVFVHGVLSDSRSCWLAKKDAEDVYWPRLLAEDKRFRDVGIFMGGYYTTIDAGRYEIRNAADELLAALGRDRDSSVLANDRIIFVCHSTGGIVVRYILTHNTHLFSEKEIGLVLIASPSFGSRWANKLSLLSWIYGHSVGKQLRAGNWTLKEIDAQFKNLVNERRIPGLVGIEAYENHFILHRKWLPDRQVVVTEESAGRYFGAPILLRNTDHFSSVKPTDREHPSYELLVDFLEKHFGADRERTALSGAQIVSFVFETQPTYPRLKFSVTNVSKQHVQITNLRVFKVAAMKDEHSSFRHLMGPRMKLDFNLKAAPEGIGEELLEDRVSDLVPGASEAFEITLEVENMVALIDFEAECVTASSRTPRTARPSTVALVHAPTEQDPGQIAVMERRSLWNAMLTETATVPWRQCGYQDCRTHELVLFRGAATLSFDDPERGWELLRSTFEKSGTFGFILASYADGLRQGFVSESVKAFLSDFISDPKNIKRLGITDIEVPAVTISRALADATTKIKGGPSSERGSYELGLADRLLEVSTVIDEPDDEQSSATFSEAGFQRHMQQVSGNVTRKDLLLRIAQQFGEGALEFLIATLVAQPHLFHEIHDLLNALTNQRKSIIRHDEAVVVAEWWDWWVCNKSARYSSLSWTEWCPRLAKAYEAFRATDSRALANFVLDEDEVVRFAAARSSAIEPRHLEILARDARPMIRLSVVENPLTPIELLKLLVHDQNSIVRRWVSTHRSADEDILATLKNDPVEAVRKFLEH